MSLNKDDMIDYMVDCSILISGDDHYKDVSKIKLQYLMVSTETHLRK